MNGDGTGGAAKTLAAPCRYYRVYTDPGVPCNEENFHPVERTLPLPVAETALVLVDLWSTHYIPSWLSRATEVLRSRILPLRAAAREVGMLVLHAPSPAVAKRYTAPPEDPPSLPAPPLDWPPSAFRSIYRSGEYAAFGRNPEPRLAEALARYPQDLDINPLVQPQPDEPILHTGPELHRLLAERRILHLIYAGFATNWCVMHRDYGILAMERRGYNIVLVRDATTGVEFHDTVDTLTATEIAIREFETKHAWSTTVEAFQKAVREAA